MDLKTTVAMTVIEDQGAFATASDLAFAFKSGRRGLAYVPEELARALDPSDKNMRRKME